MAVRCMIVDDNQGFLQAARTLLEQEGVTVAGVATRSIDAIRPVERLRPDVVLVDVSLGPESGFELARRLDRDKFRAAFAGDLSAEEAAFMSDSQVPWGVDALGGTISEPAWRTKSSWYLVATEDRMIPPPAQRAMSARAGSTVIEVAGSHAIYVSQPGAVAELIENGGQRDESGLHRRLAAELEDGWFDGSCSAPSGARAGGASGSQRAASRNATSST